MMHIIFSQLFGEIDFHLRNFVPNLFLLMCEHYLFLVKKKVTNCLFSQFKKIIVIFFLQVKLRLGNFSHLMSSL
jgi:hypothetical protein